MKWNVLDEALLSVTDPFNTSFNLYLFSIRKLFFDYSVEIHRKKIY